MLSYKCSVFLLLFTAVLAFGRSYGQVKNSGVYDIGTPTLTDIYVSPSGSDTNDGLRPDSALQTIEAAWNRIPMGLELSATGYRILLLPGEYASAPVYWESRWGTYQYPVILEAAEGPGTVFLPSLNVYDVRYMYFINLNAAPGTDVFHCERCQHVLLRGNTFVGAAPETYEAQETLKINQSQYIYLEDNDISGAWDNAIDFVAVQYGHITGNRVHNAGDWCMYLKGGSAYFRVENNTIYNCGTGGFTAGQGTGFQFMEAPWLQYEAYDIKFVNNRIHHTRGAGVGVQGGYNILIAYNTLYRVGQNSHTLEFVYGHRSCDGQPGEEGRERCDQYRAAGGWGNSAVADGINYVRIPNKNVYVYNNILYNPPGYQSAYQHFAVFGMYNGPEQNDSNIPAARADDNLQIRGNVFWNGGPDMPLGIEDSSDGCQMNNPVCNAVQLVADNQINTLEPQLADPANGDFAPLPGGNIFSVPPLPMPDFAWDVPVPQGTVNNGFMFGTVGAVYPGIGTAAASAAPTSPPPTVQVNPPPTLTLGQGPITLVALGDSLTEGSGDEFERGGYPGRLIEKINRIRPGSVIINLGKSGWNSTALIRGDQGLPGQLGQAVSELNRAAAAGRGIIALVWIGSNDLFYLYEYGDPTAQGENEDLSQYTANLDTILSRLRETGAVVIIALLDDQSLRPVTQERQAFTGISDAEITAMSRQVARYNTVILEKAAQYGALTVDFYNTTIFTDEATLDYDGNHPNAAGHEVSAQRWFDVIAPLLR